MSTYGKEPRIVGERIVAEQMTVVEFATRHADECQCGVERVKHVSDHVDLLIETAVTHGMKLWRCGADHDGRVSLIWESHDTEFWNGLLTKAAKIAKIKTILGIP